MGLRILGTGYLHGETPIVVNRMVAIDLHNPPSEQVDSSPSKYGIWNLSGELKPSLMKLKSLSHLDLSFNTFEGIPIPEFFGSLMNLQYLLEGLIPVSIGSLQNLVVLMLEENKLNGTQQDSLGQLTKLSYLDVSSNQLTCTVTEEHFSMLAKL
ncbi:hypothetical protein RYX36_028178 [Vicia faba]